MIPFNRPSIVGRELEYVADAVVRGHLSGDGYYTKQCHALLEQVTGAQKALLTTSCTHALEMAALLLEVGPGDEVILPSFTFVSTANAFVLRGARPVFIDIREDTLNLDERLLEGLITPRTKAIVVVHYAGVACEMDSILEIALRHGIPVIEDNAHGLFGAYKGRPLGSLGALASVSFHETKNITCGEGGALLINDPQFIERAEIIREKGTDRSRFFRGQVDKYGWVDVGSSYLPSELNAAFLLGQLEQRERVQAARRRIWNYYRETLQDWATQLGMTLPSVPGHCQHAWHLFHVRLQGLEQRQRFLQHLKERGILGVFHYLPLHSAPMGLRWGGSPAPLVVTEATSDRLARLPLFMPANDAGLGPGGEFEEAAAAVREFRG